MSLELLPPALAPWAPWLELFPAELALSLGPMTQRLAAALGPFAIPAQTGQGEPDGFGGLERRGNYERLLASEWLLAELAPDEFLRRAAASEHAFLRLERREPALARTSIVLFDTGPTQLGGPRLAHLAALVAFARRARVAGAALAWGVLQTPEAPLVAELTRDGVRALLARRTADSVTAAHMVAWRTQLEGHVLKDIWLVGGPAVARHAWPGVATVTLSDVLATGPADLLAGLRTATGRAVDVRLPLPDGPSSVRLIRDPFPPEPAAPTARERRRTRRIPVTNLVITGNGERVLAGARGGGLIVYPIPHSPQGGVGKPKLHFADMVRPPAAVGWYNRGSAAVTVNPDGAVMLFRKAHRASSSHDNLRFHDEHLPAVATTELRALRFQRDRTFFHDGANVLYALGVNADKTPIFHCLGRNVLAVADCPEWLAYISFFYDEDALLPSPWRIHVERHAKPSQWALLGPDVLNPGAAHFARDAAGNWQCAVEVEPGRWRLYQEQPSTTEWRTGDRVIGLLAAHQSPKRDLGPALLTLTSGRNFVAHQGGVTSHLTTAEDPVTHATLALHSGHLAYVTTRGTVVVLRPPYDAPLARFVVEDP